jgi:hypothetical protein
MQLISWLTFDLGSRPANLRGSVPKSDEPTIEVQEKTNDKRRDDETETIKIVTLPHPNR